MINSIKTLNTKWTKQELKNYSESKIVNRYNSLMSKAKSCKQSYVELKAKDNSNLTEVNKIALKNLISSEYNDALRYYNKSEELKVKYPNIIK